MNLLSGACGFYEHTCSQDHLVSNCLDFYLEMSAAQLLNPKAESRVGASLEHSDLSLTKARDEERHCESTYLRAKACKMCSSRI